MVHFGILLSRSDPERLQYLHNDVFDLAEIGMSSRESPDHAMGLAAIPYSTFGGICEIGSQYCEESR